MKKLLYYFFHSNPRLFVRLFYGNIWVLRNKIKRQNKLNRKSVLYDVYWEAFGSFVGIRAELEDVPIFPHGPIDIFISESAHIGKNV